MDKIIKLKGKFSTHKLIKLKSLLEHSNMLVYKLELEDNSSNIKLKYDDNNNFIIDLPGGPSLQKGSVINNLIVDMIEFSYDLNKYLIIFKT